MRLSKIDSAALAAVLLIAPPAFAQTATIVDRGIFRDTVTIGGTTLSTTSPLTLEGAPARTPGEDVLGILSDGSVTRGLLGVADIPTVFTRRDQSETITYNWTFQSGLSAGTGLGQAWIALSGAGNQLKGIDFRNAASPVGKLAVTDTLTYFDTPGTLRFADGIGFIQRAELSPAGDWMTYGYSAARGTVPIAAQAFDHVRGGVNAGTPRVIWEDSGFNQWTLDNSAGIFRFFRTGASGTADSVPLQLDGNIHLDPYGKFVLPVNPYSVSFGSPQKKFAAAWFADLFIDTLIANENIGVAGGRWLIGSTNIFDGDVSASATTITLRYNSFSNGDFAYAEKNGRTEFFKINSPATLVNLEPNPSFETNNTTGWLQGSGTLSNVTAKSYRGNRAMFFDVAPGGSIVQNTGVTLVTGTQYTACIFVRRSDAGTIAAGDVQAWLRDTYTNMTVESTGTDGWYRMCRTAAAGAGSPANPHFSFVNGAVDYYIDAVQIEAFGTARPYSDTRSTYAVLRDQDGGGANEWYAGDALFNVGGSPGFGWLDCYAIRGMRSAVEVGPACVANVRNGTSFNSWEPYAAWGQLNGIYGYGGSIFGFAGGPYSAGHITADPTFGVRLRYGTTNRMVLGASSLAFNDASGVNRMTLSSSLTFNDASGVNRVTLDSSALTFRDPAGTIRMTLATGSLGFNDHSGNSILTISTSGGTPYLELGRNTVGQTVFQVFPTEARFCAIGVSCPLQFFSNGNVQSSGNILLSSGGNIESSNKWSLGFNTGLRIVRSGSSSFDTATALQIGAVGSYTDFRIWSYQDSVNKVKLWKNSGELWIGDDSYSSNWNGVSSTVIIASDGDTQFTGFQRGAAVLVGPSGVLFDYGEASTVAGTTAVRYVRPVNDSAMFLGHPSARWKNIHLSLEFTETSNFAIVGDPSDPSKLAAVVGYSGTKVIGACTITWVGGVTRSVNGC